MGFAMAKAISSNSMDAMSKVNVFDASESRRAFLKDSGLNLVSSNREVIDLSHIVVLCVKPNDCVPLLEKEQRAIDSKLIISVAAGLELATLAKAAPKARFVRIVTNLAAVENSAISAYSVSEKCTKEDESIIEDFLECFGASVGKLEESKLHAVSAVSSSSLAFVCTAVEGMVDGGVQLGLPRDISSKLACHAVLGTGALLASGDQNLSPSLLKEKVCSPNGTSIRGVRRLEKSAIRSAYMEAVLDTYERSIEIMKESAEN
ncbi:hypothetical protein ACOME3_010450 [Neoechinorhynchus agilis]